jgi:hypothetical protein
MPKDVIHTHLDIRRQPDGNAINDYSFSRPAAVGPTGAASTAPKPQSALVQLEVGKVYMQHGFFNNAPFVCVSLQNRWFECDVMFFDGTPGSMLFQSDEYVLLADNIQTYVAGTPYLIPL